MKKSILALAVILMVSGMAWGQYVVDARGDTESIESRYSAGRFGSDVDDYMDPAFYDAKIGTFMFLGGYGGATAGPVPNGTVSVGFGKTLGSIYLGLFYAAQALDASGSHKDGKDPGTTSEKSENESTINWGNKLGVLVGVAGMGFRVDLDMAGTEDHKETIDGKVSDQTITGGPSVGLTWGTLINEKLAPYVSIGYFFPEVTTTTSKTTEGTVDKKMTVSKDARFGLNAGAWYGLSSDKAIYAELGFGANLADSYKGDKELLTDATTNPDGKEYTEGGGFDVGLYAHFQKVLTFGEAGEAKVKVAPWINLGFTSESNSYSLSDDKAASDDTFGFTSGLKIGAEYKHDKIGLYTSARLQFFDWTVTGHSGGSDGYKDKDTEWEFEGLKWTNPATTLNFGLTFTPIEGLVFGTGLSAGLPTINLQTMQITPPANAQAAGNGGAGGALSSFFGNTALSVTASYKY